MQRRYWPAWSYYAIAVLAFLLDFISKKMIERSVELYAQIEVLGNFFLITSTRNRGAAFSILQDQRWFFVLITVLVVAGIVWFIQRSYRKGNRLLLTALGLILGGAVGNFYDRAFFGEVVDFLQFNFGSYTFPIFNLADTFITVGVALVILDSLLSSKQENNHHGNGESESTGEQPA